MESTETTILSELINNLHLHVSIQMVTIKFYPSMKNNSDKGTKTTDKEIVVDQENQENSKPLNIRIIKKMKETIGPEDKEIKMPDLIEGLYLNSPIKEIEITFRISRFNKPTFILFSNLVRAFSKFSLKIWVEPSILIFKFLKGRGRDTKDFNSPEGRTFFTSIQFQ